MSPCNPPSCVCASLLNGGSLLSGVAESPLMTWGEIESTPFRLDGSDTPYTERNLGPSFKVNTFYWSLHPYYNSVRNMLFFAALTSLTLLAKDSRTGETREAGFKDGKRSCCQEPCKEKGGITKSHGESRKVKSITGNPLTMTWFYNGCHC